MSNCFDHQALMYLTSHASEFSYFVIMMRDLSVTCVIVFFIIQVNKRESNIKNEIAKTDSKHDLQELKTVLNSCRPLICFNIYLDRHKPNHVFLLEFIKLYETLKDKENDLDYIST